MNLLLEIITPNYDTDEQQSFKRFLIHLRNNGIMEMDHPPACYFASVQDGKQEIYLEWPNRRNYNSQVIFNDEQVILALLDLFLSAGRYCFQ